MEVPDQKLAKLKALWDQKRGRSAMPAWGKFTPQELRPWLGNLALISVSSHAIRLCGTNLICRFGRDATGCDIASLDETIAGSVVSYIDDVRATKAPNGNTFERVIDGHHVSFQELALPLSDDSEDIAMILLGSYQTARRPAWQ